MSSTLINRVKKTKTGNPMTKAVLLYLADCSTSKGCWPSQSTIANDLEMSEASVKRHLKSLVDQGYLTRVSQMAGKRITKTLYSFFDGKPIEKCEDDGIRENPPDSVTVNGSESSMVSERTHLGITVNPPIYKEVLNDNRTTNIADAPKLKKKKAVGEESDHQKGMRLLREIVGPISDGGGQGKALKFMLENGLTIDQIEKGLRDQFAAYNPKGMRTSFMSLQKTIFQSIQAQPKAEIEDTSWKRPLPYADLVYVGFLGVADGDWMRLYEAFRDDWVTRYANRANEVADYERSKEFAERAGRAGREQDGIAPSGSWMPAQTPPQMSVS